MAQNITLLGANYTAVPGVQLPKTGGGTALFTDVTPTTASAADVAQGKIFFDASGSQQIGTASGGGGGSPKKYVMRPDAELVHTYSDDKLAVEDLGLTIPAYATSSKTLKAAINLSPTITLDTDNYNYYLVFRCLSIPIYNTSEKVAGRCDYVASSNMYEISYHRAGAASPIDGSDPGSLLLPAVQSITAGMVYRCVYWRSSTNLSVAGSTTGYGTYISGTTPAISGKVITPRSPAYGIRGHSTYMSSTAWGQMVDIREQWIEEVWRAPIANLEGWNHLSTFTSIFNDVRNGGDLT